MSKPKRYLCDGCNINTEAIGTYCVNCTAENEALYKIYERLLTLEPNFNGKGISRVFLQLAISYLSKSK